MRRKDERERKGRGKISRGGKEKVKIGGKDRGKASTARPHDEKVRKVQCVTTRYVFRGQKKYTSRQ